MSQALESLKNFHFNVLLLRKVYIVWAKRVQRSYFSGKWIGIQNWRGVDLSFQNWYKEFDRFWPERLKVSTISTLIISYWVKYILFELKNCREVIFHEIEKGYKNWRWIDLSFQNWQKEFDQIWPGHSKVSKNFTLIISFWAKHILFELKK